MTICSRQEVGQISQGRAGILNQYEHHPGGL